MKIEKKVFYCVENNNFVTEEEAKLYIDKVKQQKMTQFVGDKISKAFWYPKSSSSVSIAYTIAYYAVIHKQQIDDYIEEAIEKYRED